MKKKFNSLPVSIQWNFHSMKLSYLSMKFLIVVAKMSKSSSLQHPKPPSKIFSISLEATQSFRLFWEK